MSRKKLDRIEQARHDAHLVELRTVKGMTIAEIAISEGYSSIQAAHRAVKRALSKLPEPPSVWQARRDNEVTGDYLRKLYTHIAENPQPQHTSIGRIMWNVTLCSCPNQGISQDRKDHTPECAIKPVMDYSTSIRAGEALRKLGDQKRDDARKPIPENIAMRQAMAWLATLPRPALTAEVIDVQPHGHQDHGQQITADVTDTGDNYGKPPTHP